MNIVRGRKAQIIAVADGQATSLLYFFLKTKAAQTKSKILSSKLCVCVAEFSNNMFTFSVCKFM